MSQIVIANRLRDGLIVYFTADNGWSHFISDAAVGDEALLEAARAFEAANIVVGAELLPVRLTDAGPEPLTMRERIRAHGPTVRPDLRIPHVSV